MIPDEMLRFLRSAITRSLPVTGMACVPAVLDDDGTLSKHPSDEFSTDSAALVVVSNRSWASFLFPPELNAALVADMGNYLEGDVKEAIGKLFLGKATEQDLAFLKEYIGRDVTEATLKDEIVFVPESDEVRGWGEII